MAGLKQIDGYEEEIINICPNDSMGAIIELEGLYIQLPVQPDDAEILFSDLPRSEQHWVRQDVPQALKGIRSMDEWAQQPSNLEKPIVHISKGSLSVGAKAFGCTLTVKRLTSQETITLCSNGSKLMAHSTETI